MMMTARRFLVLALLTAAGCAADDAGKTQVITGRVASTDAVGVRAVSGSETITAASIRADGSFTLQLPAGKQYRLEVLTKSGVQDLVAQKAGAWGAVTFKVCTPTDPYDMGGVGEPGTSGDGNPGQPDEMCPDPGAPNCGWPDPEPCTNADGSPCDPPTPTDPCEGTNDPNCNPMCPDPAAPNCGWPEPDPGCDPATGMDCPEPPPPCDGSDPSCPVDPMCPDPSDPNCGWPPPDPGCSDPSDPACNPMCPEPDAPNCGWPEPPPPCEDAMDPTSCEPDPCANDPMSCGCTTGSDGSTNCWPTPGGEPGCKDDGTCTPDDGWEPDHPPGDFGCEDGDVPVEPPPCGDTPTGDTPGGDHPESP